MTVEAYQKLLNAHDWYYMMSDDHRVFKRGQAQRDTLNSWASRDDTYLQMLHATQAEKRHA